MPLIPAQCTNCGAELEVDSSKDAAICPYCNSAYVVEKAINNYNVTNNIENSVVNIYSNSAQVKSDFEIEGHTLKAYIGESEVVDNIPSHITVIGEEAFHGNKKITKVVIPKSVITIESVAFRLCDNLKEIVFSESLEEIGPYDVFYGCTSLEYIKLPPKLKIIGADMFGCCSNLKEIIIPNGVEEIWGLAFMRCVNLRELIVPASVKVIYGQAFLGCHNLNKVIFENGDNITSMGHAIFKECFTMPEIVPQEMANRYLENFEHELCGENDRKSLSEESQSQKKGCYIATCIYGSYDCPEVWTLRRFRDNILDKNLFGRLFIKIYYSISPKLVKYFGDYSLFKIVWRKSLDSLLQLLRKSGIEDTPYKDL